MSGDIRHIRFLELDPRMKLLLVVVFVSATFSAPNLLALIWMYLLVVVLYLARGLWLGAKKTAMLFAVFLLINLILSFVPQSKFAAGVGMILFMLERVVVFFVMGAWMGSKLRVSDFVTAMQNKPNYVSSTFGKLLAKNNLRHIRFHDLRHTCASLLLANGVPMEQVKEWLGHSEISTTVDIYGHLQYATKKQSAAAIEQDIVAPMLQNLSAVSP